jgi:hypothetical protein
VCVCVRARTVLVCTLKRLRACYQNANESCSGRGALAREHRVWTRAQVNASYIHILSRSANVDQVRRVGSVGSALFQRRRVGCARLPSS